MQGQPEPDLDVLLHPYPVLPPLTPSPSPPPCPPPPCSPPPARSPSPIDDILVDESTTASTSPSAGTMSPTMHAHAHTHAPPPSSIAEPSLTRLQWFYLLHEDRGWMPFPYAINCALNEAWTERGQAVHARENIVIDGEGEGEGEGDEADDDDKARASLVLAVDPLAANDLLLPHASSATTTILVDLNQFRLRAARYPAPIGFLCCETRQGARGKAFTARELALLIRPPRATVGAPSLPSSKASTARRTRANAKRFLVAPSEWIDLTSDDAAALPHVPRALAHKSATPKATPTAAAVAVAPAAAASASVRAPAATAAFVHAPAATTNAATTNAAAPIPTAPPAHPPRAARPPRPAAPLSSFVRAAMSALLQSSRADICSVQYKHQVTKREQMSANANGDVDFVVPVDISEVQSDASCMLCLETFADAPDDIVQLADCSNHWFHRKCMGTPIEDYVMEKRQCPSCKTPYGGALLGDMPPGSIYVRREYSSLPGFSAPTLVLEFRFPPGNQGELHPHPSRPYYGDNRVAYLPDCPEGREVFQLLLRAWEQRLLFTIGYSLTRQTTDDCIIFNGIHLKTSRAGGEFHHGWPDATYFARVKDELAAKNIK